MKALAAALLVSVAACGQGHAVFNVDVVSFLQPSGKDTVGYNIVTALAVSADSFITPVKISLPSGLGSSTVDSVSVAMAGVIDNQTGTGSVTFEIFFAQDSASTYTGTPYLHPSATISGTQPSTVPLLAPDTVSLADSVFNTNTLWVGVHAALTKNAGANLTGRIRMTMLTLRIVLQDKVL